MKRFFLLLLLAFLGITFAQEVKTQKLDSKITDVTVFLNNAQIKRVKKVKVPQGESVFIFTGLSPFINPESIQVSASGPLMILSVKSEKNYQDENLKPPALENLEKKYKALQDKMTIAKTDLELTADEIDLLQKNKVLSGKNQSLTVQALRAMETYYATKMKELKFKQLKQRKVLKELQKQVNNLVKEIKKIADIKRYPPTEIIVSVSSKKPFDSTFKLTYNVEYAAWFPTYDIRVDNIDKPMSLTYKANVKQATQVDWKNVNLTLSSTNPTVSNEIPRLPPYRLGYYNPVSYKGLLNFVTGTVTDAETGEPLPGVNITIKGTSIATPTDFDGKFKLTLPKRKNNVLQFNYIGYETLEIPVTGPMMYVEMKEASERLQEVVVAALGVSQSDDLDEEDGFFKEKRSLSKPVTKSPKKAEKNIEIPLDRFEKQTSVNFKIKRAYTVQSNNQVKVIPVINYDIPAKYEYITVPKLDANAFLTAQITGWEKYNLLSGEAQVFIEGTSVGKTLLDTGFASDTLQVSLGVDKGIHIERKLDKQFTGKQFIGNKRTDTRKWRIIIKNNKAQAIDIKIIDQVPISDRDNVNVEVFELSKGKLNKETGEVVWKLHIKPGEKKELILHYAVKHPKYDNIVVE